MFSMQQTITSMLKTTKTRALLLVSVFLCHWVGFPAHAGAMAQDMYQIAIDVNPESMSLREVFDLVESRTDFRFVYPGHVDVRQTVTLNGAQKNLGALLDYVGEKTGLSFRLVNKNILVKTIARKSALGGIRGRITDRESGEVLPGASVIIKGTNFGGTSDVNGEFMLRVAAGTYEVETSYLGFKSSAQSVTVEDNQFVELNIQLEADALMLKDIVITGVLQGQQKALNQQKAADNIKNVVSADQIGRFPDPNVAEALQRVPGVNIERDQGEGRYVLVRGLAPQFTNISINGEQIPSPEAGVRFVALDAIPADQLASIEVSKAITPDMDGDAIGGSVNLITRTAQSEQLSVSSSLLGGYNQITERTNLQGSLELSKRFLNNKLGIMINSSYYETDRGSDNWERDEDELELRDYELLRTRLGLSSTIDYRFNDKNELYFRSIYNRFTDREWRRRYVLVPNVDNSPFESNEIERFTKDRLEKQIVTSFNLGARHQLKGFNLDYEVAYAEAIQDTPFDIEAGSVFEADELSIDFETNRKFPSFSVNGLAHTNLNNDYLDNSNYEFDDVTMGNTYALDVNKTAKFNITIPLANTERAGQIKFGGKVRLKEKSYDITENVFSWAGGDVTFPGFEPGDFTLEKFSGGTVDNNFLDGRYRVTANADIDKLVRHFNANQAGYELDVEGKLATEAVEAYEATEDVYAGYAMTRLQFNKLMVLAGARYEMTKVAYQSQEVVYDFQGDLQDIVPVSGSTDYSFLLPQLHLKYDVNASTNIRFAATRSYARPNFEDIIPAQEIELNAREGTIGNPALKPVGATNIDLMGEKYFGNVGILSAGVFYKRLDDFIFNRRFVTTAYPGADGINMVLNQAQNGESATLFGVEFAYQKNLEFIKGVSVYANYTLTSSRANIQSREDIGTTEKIRLPGQAQHVGNLSLAYDFKKFNIRLSANFNGEYLTEVGSEKSEDLYVRDRVQIDGSASYTVSNKFRIFAEFLNMTNQPFEVFQGSEDRYIQREFYSWWTRLGVKFDF